MTGIFESYQHFLQEGHQNTSVSQQNESARCVEDHRHGQSAWWRHSLCWAGRGAPSGWSADHCRVQSHKSWTPSQKARQNGGGYFEHRPQRQTKMFSWFFVTGLSCDLSSSKKKESLNYLLNINCCLKTLVFLKLLYNNYVSSVKIRVFTFYETYVVWNVDWLQVTDVDKIMGVVQTEQVVTSGEAYDVLMDLIFPKGFHNFPFCYLETQYNSVHVLKLYHDDNNFERIMTLKLDNFKSELEHFNQG